MMRSALLVFLGAVVGGIAVFAWKDSAGPEAPRPPAEWVARVGDEYITREEFIDEMARRGGRQPGQYRSVDQRRLLLNEMIIRKSLVDAARRDGFDAEPEIRRALDSVLVNRYRQARLEPLREAIRIDDADVRRYYEQRADQYSVPGRKRIAMLYVEVPEGAPEDRWDVARERLEQALAEVAEADLDVPHFGDVARRYSDDQASRYRGGVVGWLSEDSARPRFNETVADAAMALDAPGEISPVLRGEDGYYVVRLVQSEPRRERTLAELESGIRQRILSEELRRVETEFLDARLAAAETEINDRMLEQIEPLSGPARGREGPPAGPTDAEDDR